MNVRVVIDEDQYGRALFEALDERDVLSGAWSNTKWEDLPHEDMHDFRTTALKIREMP